MKQVKILADIIVKGGSVCLTGEMPECDRLEIMNVFNAMGLEIQMSPNKHSAFVLIAEGAKQSKIDRANALGIPIFSTEDFWEAISLVYPFTK